MLENTSVGKGLLVRAEPLQWAEELCQRMVRVERTADGALLLEADPAWAGSIKEVLVKKGVRVSELSSWRLARSTAA
jgi:hypothetical protein